MLRAVLFDLGETLLHFGSADIYSCFRQGARLVFDRLLSEGKPLADFDRFHRSCLRAVRWAYFWSRLRRRELDVAPLLCRQLARFGVQVDMQAAGDLASLFYEPLRRAAQPEPGAHEVLGKLRDASIGLAVVSNTFVPGAALDAHLDREGLLEFLPVRVYSCDVGYRKPDPRIFRIALNQLAVRPAQAMFVGDALQVDIKGANRVGMLSVWKVPHDFPAGAGHHHRKSWASSGKAKPDHVIRCLAELPDLIQRHRQGRHSPEPWLLANGDLRCEP